MERSEGATAGRRATVERPAGPEFLEPRVRITPQGIEVDGQTYPLMSGAMHYWRLDPERWGQILDQVKGMGYSVVETYIPWSVHEGPDGAFDFGERRATRNLEAFFAQIQARDMFVIVRPGPHINSELTDFGFPERVLKNPDVQMRTATGTVAWFPGFPRPFPIPSYGSEVFYREVEVWFDAVMPRIAANLYPLGPVIAVQVDNELSNFFRTGLYDVDYHPDLIPHYRRFVLNRYGTLAELNRVYGLHLSNIEGLEPPRRYRKKEALEYHLDWARFQTRTLLMAWQRIKSQLLRHVPVHTPFFTNLPLRANDFPFDLGKIETLMDQVGIDLYYTRRDVSVVGEAARVVNARTRLPSCPEFGAGCFLTWTPTTPDDNIQTALAATMFGVRSFNFYMLVDRERWYGSPIRTDGSRREPLATFYAELNRLFEVHRLHERPRRPPAAILRQQSLDRLMAVGYLLQPISPLILSGTRQRFSHYCREDGPFAMLTPYEKRMEAAARALNTLELDYDLGEVEQNASLLARYPILIAPTFERLDAEAFAILLARARAGTHVVCGPEKPLTSLEGGKPLPWPEGPATRSGEGWQSWAVGQGALILAQTLEPCLKALASQLKLEPLGVRSMTPDDPAVPGAPPPTGAHSGVLAGSLVRVEAVRQAAYQETSELVWILNGGHRQELVQVDRVASLRDFFSQESFEGTYGRGVAVPMEPYSVRVLEVVTPVNQQIPTLQAGG